MASASRARFAPSSITTNRHGCRLWAEGASRAASSNRRIVAGAMGDGRKRRTERRRRINASRSLESAVTASR